MTTAVLQPGEAAPDFEAPVLRSGVRHDFRLSGHLGRQNLVLAFYPANWESVSGRQLVEYQVEREKFLEREAEIIAVSVDHILNATAWEREIGPFDFLLASDFWPHGDISRGYGVLRERQPWAGAAERAVFVIDKTGKIASSRIYSVEQMPPVNETLQVLRALP